MRFLRTPGAVLALSLLAGGMAIPTPRLLAQAVSVNGGSIQGTITDPQGAAVTGASVVIANPQTGYSRTLTTDTAGVYSLGPLNPGNYTVTVSAAGFEKLIVNTVIRTGTATPGNFKLKVGQSTVEVEVNSGAVQINTDQPGVSGVITSEQIDSLPINGRNFLDLAQLEPGVQLQDGNTFDPTKAGYSALAVNGFSGRTTRILLDGQDITDENVGTTIFNVSEGAIGEFQINHSTQDASGELTSTGQVLVSTRSGTNAFHGQAFYNFQDHRAGFAEIQGIDVPFQRNQFGGGVGGPILKDKLFFFAEGERIKQDQSAASSLAKQLLPIQQAYPTLPSPYRENYSTGRLDWDGPWGGHFFGRVNYDVNASVAGSSYSLYTNRDNTWGTAFGADFAKGSVTHSFRGSYEKFHNLIGDITKGNKALYNPVPTLNIELGAYGLYTGPNDLAPQITYQSDKQLRYDGSWTHGRHSVRFGGELNRLQGGGLASFFGLAPRVYLYPSTLTKGGNEANPFDYTFRNAYVGNGQGYFSEKPAFGLPGGGQEDWRTAFYLADEWKVLPNMAITAAIRYNRDTGRANQDLGVIPCSDIDPANFSSVPCTGSTPLLDQFQAGLGKKINQPNMNFGPMVGLTFSPGGNGKTVLRGGFGVYYDSNIWNNILFDRENRLSKGLFNQYNLISCSGGPQVPFPGGNLVTSSDGIPLTTLCKEPLSQSYQAMVDLQASYQKAVAAAGAGPNPAYVGETLNIPSAFYSPNYVSPYSLQFNGGIQQQLATGLVLSVDYVHSATLKIQQSIDVNHVGAARFLNKTAAQNAINAYLSDNGYANLDDAIAGGAQIEDLMNYGLDSGNDSQGGSSGLIPTASNPTGDPNFGAAFPGANPNVGIGLFNIPNGRAGYDALQVNLRQQSNKPLPGIVHSNFELSYSLSRITTTSRGGSNAFFTAGAWDYDAPTRYMGPADLDQTHQLSFGGAFELKHGPQIALIGHLRSAPPTTLTLDNTVENNIFQTDVDGDGQTGDLLPLTNPGAYMRDIKPGNIGNALDAYNARFAGKPTPAGQALVNAGLLRADQLVSLNAVQQPIYNGSTHVFANPMYKSVDASFSYPIKMRFISEAFSLEPKVSIYNVANFAAWSGATGTLINVANAGSDGGGAYGYTNGTNGFDFKNQQRVQRGTGTFDQGGPRSMEFQMVLHF